MGTPNNNTSNSNNSNAMAEYGAGSKFSTAGRFSGGAKRDKFDQTSVLQQQPGVGDTMDVSKDDAPAGGSASFDHAISVRHLDFEYKELGIKALQDVSLDVRAGSRTLLLGANGAGKTTLMRIIAGRHMIPRDSVTVLGRPAFHDTSLHNDVAFLSANAWMRDVAFTGYGIALQADIPCREMLFNVPNIDPVRRDKVIKVMGVDLDWRIHRLSDGQRRRLQIAMGLLVPYKVLLLDEVTTDLDVIARQDLLQFLKEETEERGACILYATHIFDGIESWATDLVYIANQGVKANAPINEVPELVSFQEAKTPNPLLKTVEQWLRAEKAERAKQPKGKQVEVWYGDAFARTYADGTVNPYAVAANRHLNK